jgi:hypothetical protein
MPITVQIGFQSVFTFNAKQCSFKMPFSVQIECQYAIGRNDVDFIWNSSSTLYIQTKQSHFYSAGVRDNADGGRSLRFSKEFDSGVGRILGSAMVQSGNDWCLVAEGFERVAILVNGSWQPVVDDQAVSVRTFPGSKRYKNLIAITLNDGVMIASIFDENAY